jgi:hypothetical protein
MSTERGLHAHTSVQPTLIVLANFEKKNDKNSSLDDLSIQANATKQKKKIFTYPKQ